MLTATFFTRARRRFCLQAFPRHDTSKRFENVVHIGERARLRLQEYGGSRNAGQRVANRQTLVSSLARTSMLSQ